MPKLNYGIGGFANYARNLVSDTVDSAIPKELNSFRVKDIILDENHPHFSTYGEWASIGMVLIEDVTNPSESNDAIRVAYPLFPNIKHYPLLNEIVAVIDLPDSKLEEAGNSKISYYFPPINIWGTPHHNAIPGTSNPPFSLNKSISQVLGGSPNKTTNETIELKLGKTFIEQSNINPLKPFEGDHIIEGRFGNSIRFGATAPGPNDWSTSGQTGDPITIIRNGQSDELDDRGWEPTTEDVNRDPSSIYLTSTQKLDKFVPASLNWQSWGAKPTVVEDPLTSLDSPVIEEYVEPEPTTTEDDITDALIANAPTGSSEPTPEETIEAEDNAPPPPTPEKVEEQDELSLYDELIESGDFTEEDFEIFETETITGVPIGIDYQPDIQLLTVKY